MRQRGQGGFTLVEVLLALTLMSLLLGVLYGGLQVVTLGWDRAETRTEAAQAQRQVLEFLRRGLRQGARVYERNTRNNTARIGFNGDSRSLHWVTPMMPYISAGGLSSVDLARNDDGQLTWSWSPFRPDGNGPEPRTRALLDAVDEMAIDYFGALPGEEDPTWRDQWDDPQTWPLLVRIRLTVGGEALPALIAPVAG